MDSEFCTLCKNAGDLVCYCSNLILCYKCVGKHLIESPSTPHKPVLLKDFHMRSLLNSSWDLIKQKESEILKESSHYFEIEKSSKSRILKELQNIDDFVNDSLMKLHQFLDVCKSELEKMCSEIEFKLKSQAESYKIALQSDPKLIDLLKSQSSCSLIDSFELSSLIFQVDPPNLNKIISECVTFEFSPLYFGTKLEQSQIFEKSPSPDTSLNKRSRTRVSTKINKKNLPLCVYSCNEGSLSSFNIQTAETEFIDVEVNKFSVCTITAEGSIVITGGLNSNSAFIYQIFEKTIEKTENMFFYRVNHAATSLGDFVYVMGGRDQNVLKSCERFDLVHKKWQKIGDLFTAREKHSACVYRGRIFVAGGNDLDTIEVYNTVSNKFSLLRTVLSSPGPSLMFSVEDFMIIFHGKLVSMFDPAKFTCQNFTNLEENDWYSNSSLAFIGKVAYFVRQKIIFEFQVEDGTVKVISHLG